MLWKDRSVNLLGTLVHDVPRGEWQAQFKKILQGEAGRVAIATPNPEFLVDATWDPAFRLALGRMDVSLPDGAGLGYAAVALTGQPIANRYTGVEALQDILELAAEVGQQKVVVFGGQKPEEYQKYVASLRRERPTIQVEYVNPGLIDPREPKLSEVVREALRLFAPTIVFVVLTHKKQVPIMLELLEYLPSLRLAIGVGGAIDMALHPELAAPLSFRERGLEWVWRLYQEPWRYKRIFNAVVVWPGLVVVECVRLGRLRAGVRDVYKFLKLNVTKIS
jgi:N-acetylglucosaminyldiphosphoundecaprenol N-acetyl-beta-D-mannosaminyltransferase